MTTKPSETITISEFTTTCHAVLERVCRTGASIIVARRGEPMAETHPPTPASTGYPWLGAMHDSAVIAGDLIAPASDITARGGARAVKLLLDTSISHWALIDPVRLTPAARVPGLAQVTADARRPDSAEYAVVANA